jgi:hypothetical protein
MVDSIPFYKHHLVEPVLNQEKVVCYMFCSCGLIDPKGFALGAAGKSNDRNSFKVKS